MIAKCVSMTLDPALLARFSGIRVIADVHGSFEAFDVAIRQAKADGRFIVQLGDLIDRGPYSPFCVERMLEVEDEGCGQMLLGNHEVSFARFLTSGQGGATPRQETLQQFEQYSTELLARFIERIERGPLWIRTDTAFFVHAAFHPKMLGDEGAFDAELCEIAIHGYGNSRERRSGAREREWVNAIPKDLTVVVGHVVTESKQIERLTSRRGGTAIFADTGLWREQTRRFPILDIC